MSKVTIKDVAKELNVSVSLVSKALNGYSDVSDEKRKFIIDGAKKLGYVANVTASNLAMKKGNKIAIIIESSKDNNYIDEIIMRYTSSAFKKSAEMKLSPVVVFFDAIEEMNDLEVVNYFLSMDIIGVILFGVTGKSNLNKLFEYNGIKKVIIDDKYKSESVTSISTNNREAQYEIANKFCNVKTFSDILYLQGNLDSETGKARNEGFNLFIKEHSEKRITKYSCNFDEDAAYDAIVNHKGNIDVIVCASDLMAISSVRACNLKGISPLIIGFDGIRLIKYSNLKVVSVAQNFELISESAVTELKELIDGKAKKRIYIPYSIVEN